MLTADGSRTLRLGNTGITYHSASGAVSESRAVYLENSRILQWPDSGECLRVLEIGFGTGLNFLLTADAANDRQLRLEYVALDSHPVSARLLPELAYATALGDASLVDALVNILNALPAAPGRVSREVGCCARLELWLGNALEQTIPVNRYHAIYLDPFGPRVNPELWDAGFLEDLYHALIPGGRLTSYCVKSSVQQDLRRIGFEVTAVPGPAGGKRQVLVAIRTTE